MKGRLKYMTREAWETLEMINSLGEASSTVIAKNLDIKRNALTGRTNSLSQKSLIKYRRHGKEKLFSITDSGRKLLLERKSPDKPAESKLVSVLERLLGNSFDGAYLFIDIFFEKPLCSLTNYSTQDSLKIAYRDPLFTELCCELLEFICFACDNNYTKEQFSAHLFSMGVNSNEMKGFIYYIANRYEALRKQEHKKEPD